MGSLFSCYRKEPQQDCCGNFKSVDIPEPAWENFITNVTEYESYKRKKAPTP
jgi:hypothetical protein